MRKSFRDTCQEVPETEQLSIEHSLALQSRMDNSAEEEYFIMKEMWSQKERLSLSVDLSFNGASEEQIALVPDLPQIIPSTNSLVSQKREIQMEMGQNQRQEKPTETRENKLSSMPLKTKNLKKEPKGKSNGLKKRKSKRVAREKRDNNYVMKRAHTVLKRCCWSIDKELRNVTRLDSDGSMDYFVRLLCRLEASKCHEEVIQVFHREADLEIKKVESEIEQEGNDAEIRHLRNVIAVLLKGKQAADIFEAGDRIEAMEIMYGKGMTLKKVYKMEKAIGKLQTLIQDLSLGVCESQAIPDILGM